MSAAGQIFAPCKICIHAIPGDRAAAKDLAVNNFPILWRVRLLDWQVSAAGQIFAPAKSAFMPSMAISRRRQAYTDVFTQPLNSIVHQSWLIVLLI